MWRNVLLDENVGRLAAGMADGVQMCIYRVVGLLLQLDDTVLNVSSLVFTRSSLQPINPGEKKWFGL